MSNLSIYVRLGADVLTEQEMFYGLKTGWGFKILITMGTFLTGFCLAGLFRSVVVNPPELIWPGVLSTTSLATTLHHIGRGDQLYVYLFQKQTQLILSAVQLHGGFRGMPFSASSSASRSAGTGFQTSYSRLSVISPFRAGSIQKARL